MLNSPIVVSRESIVKLLLDWIALGRILAGDSQTGHLSSKFSPLSRLDYTTGFFTVHVQHHQI
jgi:hypothetical protein